MSEVAQEKVIRIEFTNNNFVHASYNPELENFLKEINPNTSTKEDVRIFSTYFYEQWPYKQKYVGFRVYDTDG